MVHKCRYGDGLGNTYQVERATNGKFIIIRINAGGNRKRAGDLGEPANNEERMQRWLDNAAKERGWKEVPQ